MIKTSAQNPILRMFRNSMDKRKSVAEKWNEIAEWRWYLANAHHTIYVKRTPEDIQQAIKVINKLYALCENKN